MKAAELQFCFILLSCSFYRAQFDTNKIDFPFLWGWNWVSVPSTTPLPVAQPHKTSKIQQNAIFSEQQPMKKKEKDWIRGDKEMRCQFPYWIELSRDTTCREIEWACFSSNRFTPCDATKQYLYHIASDPGRACINRKRIF